VEKGKSKEQDTLYYLEEFAKLTSIHKPIQDKIKEHIRILKALLIPFKQTMMSAGEYEKKIKNEISNEEYSEVYSDMPVLASYLPDYQREMKNLRTLDTTQTRNFVNFIIELIEVSNEIKVPIKVHLPAKESKMDEQEKSSFESFQNADLLVMDLAKSKAEFNSTRFKIKGRIKNKEQQDITDELSLKVFGKKIGDMEWTIGGKKKKKTNAEIAGSQ